MTIMILPRNKLEIQRSELLKRNHLILIFVKSKKLPKLEIAMQNEKNVIKGKKEILLCVSLRKYMSSKIAIFLEHLIFSVSNFACQTVYLNFSKNWLANQY